MKKKLFLLIIFFVCLSNMTHGNYSYQDYISRSNFIELADVVITNSTYPETIQNNSVVFLSPKLLNNFFDTIYPKIKNKFILITHGSDKSMPDKYAYVLDDDKLIAWFAQNVDNYSHKKLIPIPIGIGYSYNNSNSEKIYKVKMKSNSKKHLLYMNFCKVTHNERGIVYKIFSNKPFCYSPKRLPFEAYLEDLSSSYFVLSPRGCGIDCFRTWEALYLDAIPIVRSSSLNPLYEDLPVLVIEDWNCITEQFLQEKYKEMQNKTYNFEKLTMSYWKNLIYSYK